VSRHAILSAVAAYHDGDIDAGDVLGDSLAGWDVHQIGFQLPITVQAPLRPKPDARDASNLVSMTCGRGAVTRPARRH
jgi:hypothetical protein